MNWPDGGFLPEALRLPLAVLLALSLAWVAQRALFALAGRSAAANPATRELLDAARRPAAWLAPLIALHAVLLAAPSADAPVPLATIGLVGAIAAATWLAVRLIGVYELRMRRRYPLDAADNLDARRMQTQVRVLARTARVALVVLGTAAALLVLPGARHIGASLLASAGVAGLAVGLAARPVLANLIAGIQIALTQPIRLEDVVIIEGEWGRIEQIGGAYVVVRIWDQRRLIVPLSHFIERPFENWTRSASELIGNVVVWTDYAVDVDALRGELARVCEASDDWDRRVCRIDVIDASDRAIALRALVSAADAGATWNLRCRTREALVRFLRDAQPEALPRVRSAGEPVAAAIVPR